MTRYTHADFTDDDSVNSVQLTEGISTSATHIRYHASTSIWRQRTMLEKALLVLVATLFFVIVVLTIILHSAEHRIHESRVSTRHARTRTSSQSLSQKYIQNCCPYCQFRTTRILLLDNPRPIRRRTSMPKQILCTYSQ
jgi:glutathionyl-hydroquinone reductase